MKTVSTLAALFLGAAHLASAAPVIYDDFSSGNLSKFNFNPQSPQRTNPQVISQQLDWSSSANPAYGIETLISTKNDFDLTATAAEPLILQFDLAGIDQKTGDANNSTADF